MLHYFVKTVGACLGDIHYPLFAAGGLLSFVSLSEKESSKETGVVFGY